MRYLYCNYFGACSWSAAPSPCRVSPWQKRGEQGLILDLASPPMWLL
jgi:hypothetical protein